MTKPLFLALLVSAAGVGAGTPYRSEKAPNDALQLWVHAEVGAGGTRLILEKADGTRLREWSATGLSDQTLDEVLAATRLEASPSRSIVIKARSEVKFGALKRLMAVLGPKGPGKFRLWVEPMSQFPQRILGPRP